MAKVTALKVKTDETQTGGQGVVPPKTRVTIKPPRFEMAAVLLRSTAPYVQNRFANYKQEEMIEKQKAGSSQSRTRKGKPPKDFEKLYQGSMHISKEGWHGIPANGIRQAMIDACRLTEMDMIRAKMCIRIIPDGFNRENLEPLVKIEGKPRMFLDRVRIGINQTDIIPRAMFEKWSARVVIQWDADVFTAQDIVHLLSRAGWQCGIGAGRPLSKSSGGTGKGTWTVEGVADEKPAA